MDKEILDIINNDFKIEQRNLVSKELCSINLNHVMAESEYNLKNTRMSILYLAKGDPSEVSELTKRAKIDFRDVIMWSTQEKNLKNK